MEALKDITLRVAGIIEESIVDGPGLRFVLFLQGCRTHSKGTQNPHTTENHTRTPHTPEHKHPRKQPP